MTEHVENNNNPCTSWTTGENPEQVIECFPESDFDHVQNKETYMFSFDNDPEVVFDDDNSGISMPKIFEDETKFSESISENMPKFIKMGCAQKADVSKYLDEVKIPENYKNIVTPLIHSEIWNNLFPNVQQRDKTLKDAQRILGLSIVSMISLAEMFKTNKFEMKKPKNVFRMQLLWRAMRCTSRM